MGNQKKQEEKCKFWPLGFWAGDICICQNKKLLTDKVVAVVPDLAKNVPEGHVPVVLANKNASRSRERFNIPAKDLCIYGPRVKRYPPSKTAYRCSVWAMGFVANDPIRVNGRKARVAITYPEEVMLGYVPFWYEYEAPFSRSTPYCAPADSIYRR